MDQISTKKADVIEFHMKRLVDKAQKGLVHNGQLLKYIKTKDDGIEIYENTSFKLRFPVPDGACDYLSILSTPIKTINFGGGEIDIPTMTLEAEIIWEWQRMR